MKPFLMIMLFFGSSVIYATQFTATKTPPKNINLPIKPERPIVRPPHTKPIIVAPNVVYEKNYYNTNVENSCEQYLKQIEKMNEQIISLKLEIDRLKKLEYKHLQDTLKEQHEKEVSEFDNRKNSVKSKNSIKIYSKP